MLLLTSVIEFACNYFFCRSILNFMLTAWRFPLHLPICIPIPIGINHGLFTTIYLLARAAGKYLGAYFGASITKSPKTVRKFLGLTLLPHSGVSLVFNGIAVSVQNPPPQRVHKSRRVRLPQALSSTRLSQSLLRKKVLNWRENWQHKDIS